MVYEKAHLLLHFMLLMLWVLAQKTRLNPLTFTLIHVRSHARSLLFTALHSNKVRVYVFVHVRVYVSACSPHNGSEGTHT